MRNISFASGMSVLAMATIFMLGIAIPAHADGYGHQKLPPQGFYVGGYGGYGWTDDPDVDGWDYGAFVGYEMGTLFDSQTSIGMRGAIEGFYGLSNADDGGFDKNHEWGVNFRPGLAFIDQYSPFGAQPYAILGYRNLEIDGAGHFNGFELGIGTELLAYDDFGVRLDYSHIFYSDENGLDPSTDELRMGVAYHF